MPAKPKSYFYVTKETKGLGAFFKLKEFLRDQKESDKRSQWDSIFKKAKK